jgi:dynein heavy chain
MNQPLAHFLKQEMARMAEVQDLLETHLRDIEMSINAIIQKTPDVVASITELGQGVTPTALLRNSWQCHSFGRWLEVLRRRHAQLTVWRDAGGVRPASVWLGGLFNPVGFLISVRQGVARAIRVQEDRAVALDEMALHAEVTDMYEAADIGRDKDSAGRLVAGVYLHGLVLEGAAWSKQEQSLVESAPKSLTCAMPVIYVTCLTKLQKRNTTGDYGAYGAYSCPCYTHKVRSEDTFVFNIDLSSRQHRPRHWIMRGVAILCSNMS